MHALAEELESRGQPLAKKGTAFWHSGHATYRQTIYTYKSK